LLGIAAKTWSGSLASLRLTCRRSVISHPKLVPLDCIKPISAFRDSVSDKFKTSDVMHLFPTFVWRGDVPDEARQELSETLLQELAALGAPLANLRPGENWQSEQDLHLRAGFKPLTSWIQTAARQLLDYLRVQPDIMITGCWANVNAPGTGHRLHSHRNNFISGVYYLQTQAGADTINFFDPKVQAGAIRPPANEPTAENTEVAQVRIDNGALLLFPAWLLHAVDTNRSAKPRISISFNLMFPSFAETMAQPGWTPGVGGR
jgi:uncharacterized protein (TIGR02466 family)